MTHAYTRLPSASSRSGCREQARSCVFLLIGAMKGIWAPLHQNTSFNEVYPEKWPLNPCECVCVCVCVCVWLNCEAIIVR